MKKIGLFYGGATAKTGVVALKIQETFGENLVELVQVERAGRKELEAYENIIAGVSTWFDGELPTYWDELLPEIEATDLSGKKVAIFGLGDQKNYPDNFVDGIGILADSFRNSGATLVGFTSPDGYQFNQSRAITDNHFTGLVLDIENQSDLTEERVLKWTKQLKKEFGL